MNFLNKLNKFIHSKYILLVCRLILGSVFIYAASGKIMHPHAMAKILYNYKLLPDLFIYPLALFLPWIELMAGSFLIWGIFKRGSATILTLMLAIFIVAISINLIRGLNFDCGCFSTLSGSGSHDPYLLLLRDILLIFPGIIILTEKKRGKKNEN